MKKPPSRAGGRSRSGFMAAGPDGPDEACDGAEDQYHGNAPADESMKQTGSEEKRHQAQNGGLDPDEPAKPKAHPAGRGPGGRGMGELLPLLAERVEFLRDSRGRFQYPEMVQAGADLLLEVLIRRDGIVLPKRCVQLSKQGKIVRTAGEAGVKLGLEPLDLFEYPALSFKSCHIWTSHPCF